MESKLSEMLPLIRAFMVGLLVFRVNLFHFCRQSYVIKG